MGDICMIKNILFDIGSVLVSFKPYDYIREAVQDKNVADKLYKVIFCGREWQRLDEGTITEDEAFQCFSKSCPEYREIIEKIRYDWYRILTPINGTIDIFHKLKKKGYKTYILSNYHDKAFDMIYNKYDFFKSFDGMVISSRVKLLKPDKKIFYKLIDGYHINPEETVYIDDLQINLDAAEKLGFVTILFKSPEELDKQLKALNVL
jgi:epoxide hydrolase-like predicted phosphatase